MDNSILKDSKKLLGNDFDYDAFNTDIIVFVNGELSVLNQIGIGNEIAITDDSTTWREFVDDLKVLNLVKSFVYMRVKLVFDPPQSSSVIASYERKISELDWRLHAYGNYSIKMEVNK